MANTKVQSEQIADDAVVTSHIADNVGLGGSPTTTTQSASDNSTKIATTAYVDAAFTALVDSSPAALNTLNELAAALGDDANFSTTVTNSIAAKLPLAGGTMTGDLILGDNVKLEIGSASGGDLQLYHDGSNSYVSDAGTGFLVIMTDSGIRLNTSTAEVMLDATPNGAVTLYHDNAAKLATSSSGVTVSGTLNVTGDGDDILINSDDYELFLLGNRGASGANLDKAYLRMKSEGTNTVAIDVDGSSFFNGGNVGIGTDSPTTLTELRGIIPTLTLSSSESKTWSNGDDIAKISFFSRDGSGIGAHETGFILNESENSGASLSGALVFGVADYNTAAAEAMRIDHDGNVGIGNTSPSAVLDAVGSINIAGQFTSTATSKSNDTYTLMVDSSAHNSNLSSAGAMSVDVNSGRAFTITGLGKVGIGVSVPTDYLEVNGGTAYPHLRFRSSGNTSRYMRIGMEDSTTHTIEANGSSTELHFKTAGTKRMEIQADGYTSVNNSGFIDSARAGLHVEHGGLLINGSAASGTNAIGSSNHHSNYWTFVGSGGRSGTRGGSFRIEVPEPSNASTNNAYGGFSVEIYISGFQGRFCHAMVSGYNNNGITISESAILRSGGTHSLSYGVLSGTTQGFYVDLSIDSYTHSSAYYRITKGGDTSAAHDTNFRNLKAIFT